MLGTIRKAITSLVTAVIAWFTLVINNHNGGFPIGSITAFEWLGLAIAVAGACGVYAVTNSPAPTRSR